MRQPGHPARALALVGYDEEGQGELPEGAQRTDVNRFADLLDAWSSRRRATASCG